MTGRLTRLTNVPDDLIRNVARQLTTRNRGALRASARGLRSALPVEGMPADLKKLVKQHHKTRKYKVVRLALRRHSRRDEVAPADLQAKIGTVLTAAELLELITDVTAKMLSAAEGLNDVREADRAGMYASIGVHPIPQLPRTESDDIMWITMRANKAPGFVVRPWFHVSIGFEGHNRMGLTAQSAFTEMKYQVKHAAAHDNIGRAMFLVGAFHAAVRQWPALRQDTLKIKYAVVRSGGLLKQLNASKFPKEVKAVLARDFKDIQFVPAR